MQMERTVVVTASGGLRDRLRQVICPLDVVAEWLPREGSILDVGCGDGALLAMLAREGRAIDGHGIDVGARAIEAARRKAAMITGPTGLTFDHVRSLTDWPARQFDAVAMVDVLHHVPVSQQEQFFVRACAAVRPGGVLVYKDMCRRPLLLAAANQLHDLVMARQWIHHVPIESATSWASRAHLTLTVSHDERRLWYGHQMRVFRAPAESGATCP